MDIFGEGTVIVPQAEKDKVYTVFSPVSVTIPRKTKKDRIVYLNLNTYRNLHYIINNQAKGIYKELMETQISKLPKFNKIALLFELHKGSKRKIDRHNICSIVQKFFCDALVELGKLDDDDDRFIISEKYITGDFSKGKPSVTIHIKEVE